MVYILVTKYYLIFSLKNKEERTSKQKLALAMNASFRMKNVFFCLSRLTGIYGVLESRTGVWCERYCDLQWGCYLAQQLQSEGMDLYLSDTSALR